MSAGIEQNTALRRWSGVHPVLFYGIWLIAFTGCRSFYDQTTPPPSAIAGPGAVNIPSVGGIAPIAPPPTAPGTVPPLAPPDPPIFDFFDSVHCNENRIFHIFT